MTTYKEIKGANIETVASDPSNPTNGQIWFNTTTYVVKGNVNYGTGSWATGGDLNSARNGLGGAGIQTSALAFGGSPNTANTEKYNGTSWTEVNNLNSPRRWLGSCGASNTAALGFGGSEPTNTAKTEKWNGTNWTEVNDLNTARSNML